MAALGALVIVALALRLIGIDHGRPYVYHPDEWVVVKPAILMVEYSGWNPHQFLYPSALMYAEKVLVAAIHTLTGAPLEVPIVYGFDTMGTRTYFESLPEQFDYHLAGRVLVAVTGALTVAIVFVAGRALGGWVGGLTAALVAALAPLAVFHGHYLTTDVPSALFVALALLLTVRGGGRALILAGLVAGLAASTKYNAGAVVVAPLVVALMSGTPLRDRLGLAAGITAASLVGFAMLTPVVLFDPGSIIAGVLYQVTMYSSTGDGGEPGAVHWLRYLWGAGVGPAFAVLPIASILAGRRVAGVLAFALVYFVIVSVPDLRYERNLLPLIPALAILAGAGVGHLARTRLAPLAIGLVVAGSVWALGVSIEYDRAFLRPDTRTIALDWINANVPAGSRIARENYTPQPPPARYEVGATDLLSQHPLDWYRAEGVDFLVASSYTYTEDPFYRELFSLPVVLDVQQGSETSLSPRIVVFDLRPSR